MDTRYFLDANCLLNAAFIPSSWAHKVIYLIRKRGGTLLTDYAVFDEAMKTAVRNALENQLPLGVFPFLISFVELAQVKVLPASIPAMPLSKAHDQHVKDGAVKADAILLTTDIPLRTECEANGIRAMTIYEALIRERGIGLPTCFFGVAPTSDKGTVFIRCSPCPDVEESFCLFEIGGFFQIRYDNTAGRWLLILNGAILQGPAIRIASLETLAFAVDWDEKEIRIRASGVDHPVSFQRSGPFSTVPDGVSIGHDLSGSSHWWHPIRNAVWNDQRLSKDSWALCRDHAFATPNPFDHDRLSKAMHHRLSRAYNE